MSFLQSAGCRAATFVSFPKPPDAPGAIVDQNQEEALSVVTIVRAATECAKTQFTGRRDLADEVREQNAPAATGESPQCYNPSDFWRATLRALATAALLACLCALNGWAQAGSGTSSPTGSDPKSDALPQVDGPEKGSNEWQVWVGGAYPINLSYAPQGPVGTAGATYGRVLTDPRGPGFLRSRFEWAFEVVPVVEVFLPKYPVYGVGITPVVWKWNFVTRRRLSPYWEFAGGALFSNHRFVPGGTTFNFTASTAAGVTFPWGESGKYSWTVDVRCFHVSNAGLGDRDPGLNSIELRLGFGLFSHRK